MSVEVWLCRDEDLPAERAAELADRWLDDQEHATADRFVFDRDRRQYLASHVLVRRVLSLRTDVPEAQLRFWRSHRGRPFLEPPVGGWPHGDQGLDFNLSHTHGANVVGVSSHRRIGVDVEMVDREDMRSVDRVAEAFSAGEREWLAGLPAEVRRREVLRLWVLKEAYAKACGLGLALPFDSFAFDLDLDGPVHGFRPPRDDPDGNWQFVELDAGDSIQLAVAVERLGTELCSVELHSGFPLLEFPALEPALSS